MLWRHGHERHFSNDYLVLSNLLNLPEANAKIHLCTLDLGGIRITAHKVWVKYSFNSLFGLVLCRLPDPCTLSHWLPLYSMVYFFLPYIRAFLKKLLDHLIGQNFSCELQKILGRQSAGECW